MVEEKYHIGDVVKGRVLKINPFGLFVELDSDIHGLAHISELEAADITGGIKVGDIAEFKIISLKPNEHRLGLSLKALKGNVSAPDPQASISSPDSAEVIAVPIKEETSLLAPETSDQSKDATQ